MATPTTPKTTPTPSTPKSAEVRDTTPIRTTAQNAANTGRQEGNTVVDNQRTINPNSGNQNPSTPGSSTPPDTDTSTGGDTGTPQTKVDVHEGNQPTPTPAPKPTLEDKDIDDLATLSVDELEEKYKEYEEKGLDVSEIKRKVDISKQTSNTQRNDSGRENAGKLDRTDDDPDLGRLKDDDFKIEQGDFIEFLMKEVVLASAAWVGNRAADGIGLAIYHGGRITYNKLKEKYEENKAEKEANDKKAQKAEEDRNKENLYSGTIKATGVTADYAKKVLDIRQGYIEKSLNSPEVKEAQKLTKLVSYTTGGDLDLDHAKEKNGDYVVTRTYTDDNGKKQTKNITITKETYATLRKVEANIKQAIAKDPHNEATIRKNMEKSLSTHFNHAASLILQEKIFAADYTASAMLEHASTLSPEEIKKLKPEEQFKKGTEGIGKLTYYSHLSDMEHQRSPFQATKDKSALEVMTDTANAALAESIKRVNENKNKEAFKDKEENFTPQENPLLQRLHINQQGEHYQTYTNTAEYRQSDLLKYMQTDARESGKRSEELDRNLRDIDTQINGIIGEGAEVEKQKQQLNTRKNQTKAAYDTGTSQRDAARTATFNQFRGRS